MGTPSSVAVGRGQPAVDVPGVAVEPRGRVVFVPGQPERREICADTVRHGAFLTGRARERAQLEEEVEKRGNLHRPLILWKERPWQP